MGLLDDAIREHLELKRRSGADPAEIAQQERAALQPVFPAEHHADEPEPAGGSEPPAEPDYEAEPAAAAAPAPALEEDAGEPVAHVNQETAEIDMDELMAEGGSVEAPAASRSDDFDWETPGEGRGEPLPEQVPGQERMSFE